MTEKRFKQLTPLELQFMSVIWDKNEAFINDILQVLPEPKPAYNTISTIVRILVTKGFVAYKSFGRSHQYYPLVTKEEYLTQYMSSIKETFFSGSILNMISFMALRESLNEKEIDLVTDILKDCSLTDESVAAQQ